MADVSLFGHKVKPVTAGAIVIGSGAAIWFAWKQHKSSSSTTASASSLDPVTGLPYSEDDQIDPLTGEAYLAEAQQYGSVAAAESAVAGESSLDYSSAYGTGGGSLVGTSTATPLVPADTVPGTTYATNAAWAQAVEAGLAEVGYASTDISAALGRYLANLPETADQATIVEAAIAEFGAPPVGSYQVILAPATTSTGSGNTGTGLSTGTGTGTTTTTPPPTTTTTPPPTTTTPPPATTSGVLSAPGNFHQTLNTASGVQFAWNPVSGATGYVCLLKQGGENGTIVNGPFTVSAGQTDCNFGNTKATTQYTAFVWPSSASVPGGPGTAQPHDQMTFTTPAAK